MRNNIFFIGPMRCGTTWIFDMFKQATDCSYIKGKEIYFFEKKIDDINLNSYYESFKIKSNNFIDISPTYFGSTIAAKNINSHFHSPKFFLIIRDPAEILISTYKYLMKNGLINCGFSDYISKNQYKLFRNYNLYEKSLQRWIDIFGLENIYFLDFDNFKENPSNFFVGICKSLDVSCCIDNLSFETRNSSQGKPFLIPLYRSLVYLGRNLQKVISREKLLDIRTKFIDQIFINKNFRIHIADDDRRVAQRFVDNDLHLIDNYIKKQNNYLLF